MSVSGVPDDWVLGGQPPPPAEEPPPPPTQHDHHGTHALSAVGVLQHALSPRFLFIKAIFKVG